VGAVGPFGRGIWSDVMTTLHPDRVVAVWMRSGSALMFLSHPEFTRPDVPTALYKIPMMTNPGVKEKSKTSPPDPDTRTEGEKMKGPWLATLRRSKNIVHTADSSASRLTRAPSRVRRLALPRHSISRCMSRRASARKGSKDQTLNR